VGEYEYEAKWNPLPTFGPETIPKHKELTAIGLRKERPKSEDGQPNWDNPGNFQTLLDFPRPIFPKGN